MKNILLMIIFCIVCGCVSLDNAFAQQTANSERTVETFRRIKPNMTMKQIREVCGTPDDDIGSGIHIYVYKLPDGSAVRIGTPDNKKTMYVTHVLPDGVERSLIKITQKKRKPRIR